MTEVYMFNPDLVSPDRFADTLSYRAFVFLGEKVNEILALREKGYIFFLESDLFNANFRVIHGNDGTNPSISYTFNNSSFYSLAGCTHSWSGGSFKLYLRKKEILDFLEKIRYIEPSKFKRIV